MIAWARERMMNYKVWRRVESIGAPPFDAAGKVEKIKLRARAPGKGVS
jgi:acyl-CoA synthetase (AMP-forming)/AMP-acid ligase II